MGLHLTRERDYMYAYLSTYIYLHSLIHSFIHSFIHTYIGGVYACLKAAAAGRLSPCFAGV